MDNPFQSPIIISFCPGFLGLERGLERAIGKFTVAAYSEIEAFICANLVAGMESGLLVPAPIWTDVKTFPAEMFRGKVHGIIGGYPCQPFSVAGQQKGSDDPRHLWPYISKHIETIKPVWCFFENVRGHLQLGYDEVYRSLSNLGYAVECGIYSAEEVGAPHQRERLFILAIRTEIKLWMENPTSDGEQYREQSAYISRGIYSVPTQGASEMEYPDIRRCQQPNQGKRDIQQFSEGCEQLADPGLFRQKKYEQPATGIKQCGSELGNPDCNGNTEGNGFGTGGSDTGETEREKNKRERFRLESIPASETTGDTDTTGCRQPGGAITVGQEQPPVECTCTFNGWPARPGQPQYEWEEKRTTEPGMGNTINGYNFREDLLRALGNSVVEQTAEIAFIDLLRKHNKS